MKKYIVENGECSPIAEFETEADRWRWTKENCIMRYVANDWGWYIKDTNEQIFYYETR